MDSRKEYQSAPEGQPKRENVQIDARALSATNAAIDGMRDDEKQGAAKHMMMCVSKLRRGAFIPREELNNLALLQQGYDVLRTLPGIDSTIENAAATLWKRVAAEAAVLHVAHSDHTAEQHKRATEGSQAAEIQKKLLLDEAYEKGRTLCHTSLDGEFAQNRKMHVGFQSVVDQRLRGNPFGMTFAGSAPVNLGVNTIQGMQHLLREKGATAAVTISPLKQTIPIYSEPKPQGRFRTFLFGEEPRQQIGKKEEVIPMSKYTGNTNEIEPAYQITYIVVGINDDEKSYRDPTTGRNGNVFMGCAVLPEQLARKVFAQIQKNPRLARELFRRYEPELMRGQEQPRSKYDHNPDGKQTYMPKEDKLFIVPEGKNKEAYEWGKNPNMPERIKDEYIVNIT